MCCSDVTSPASIKMLVVIYIDTKVLKKLLPALSLKCMNIFSNFDQKIQVGNFLASWHEDRLTTADCGPEFRGLNKFPDIKSIYSD